MDSFDLEKLQTFISPDIFEFLTAGKNLTEPPRDATPIEAELMNDHGQAEAELVANPFEVGLD